MYKNYRHDYYGLVIRRHRISREGHAFTNKNIDIKTITHAHIKFIHLVTLQDVEINITARRASRSNDHFQNCHEMNLSDMRIVISYT